MDFSALTLTKQLMQFCINDVELPRTRAAKGVVSRINPGFCDVFKGGMFVA